MPRMSARAYGIMQRKERKESGFSLSVYARCHGFTRTIDMAKRSSTKTRYRLMRPVNEWKLQHVKIDTLWVLI